MSLPSIQRVLLESVADADKDGRFVIVNNIQTYYKLTIPQQHQILLQNQMPLPNEPHKPVILCLHHMLGNLYTWRYMEQPLADATGCHVISYDRLSFGFTERPTQWEEDNNPYTQEASVEFVVQFLEQLGYGGRKVAFIGTSSGASISCVLATRYPHIVHSLILLGPAIRLEDQGPPPMACHILGSLPGRLYLKAVLYRSLPYMKLYHNPESIPDWESVMKPCYRAPLTLPNFYEAFSWLMRYFRPLEILGHKHVLQQLPICYVSGDDDKYTHADIHKEIFNEIKLNAPEKAMIEFYLIDKCGHLPQEESPQQVLDVTINFIKRVGI